MGTLLHVLVAASVALFFCLLAVSLVRSGLGSEGCFKSLTTK